MDAPTEVLCNFRSSDRNAYMALQSLISEVALDIKDAVTSDATVFVKSDESGVEINGWKLSFITGRMLQENSLSSDLMKGAAFFVMGKETVLPLLLLLAVAKRCGSGKSGNKVSLADSDGNALEAAIGPASPILARMGVDFEEIRVIAERLGIYAPGVNELLRRAEGRKGSAGGFWF